MFQPEGVTRAALRWLDLLPRSTVEQAAAILGSDPAYADLSLTQYAMALEWLEEVGLLVRSEYGLQLIPEAQVYSKRDQALLVFNRAIETSRPAWLPDADVLVLGVQELPEDAWNLSRCLDLTEAEALGCIRQVHGHIDLAERAEVGAAGERALIKVLESVRPGSTRYIAEMHDGFGYDLAFTLGAAEWHLEVKSTTRRGRLTVHLSRHELEVAGLDPHWVLVIVGLSDAHQLTAVGTVPKHVLQSRAPVDTDSGTMWESARYELGTGDVEPGLHLGLETMLEPLRPWSTDAGPHGDAAHFAWLPTRRIAAS